MPRKPPMYGIPDARLCGNNGIPGLNWENQVQGPKIFDAVDQAMRTYIPRDHAGSKSTSRYEHDVRAWPGLQPGACDHA